MSCARVCVAVFVLAIAPLAAFADGLAAAAGKALFKRQWVPAPSSTEASDGLGPLYNARSCSACHQGGGGARVVTDSHGKQTFVGAVVRLASPAGGDPYYGIQLQTNAVQNLTPEAEISFLPKLSVKLLGPALGPETKMAVRVAPSLFGAADLDRISDDEIRSRADPDDKDGDGISGRVNETDGGIGRYGWKAAQATQRGQISNAFAVDLGLSNPLYRWRRDECTKLEFACLDSPNGDSPVTDNREVSSAMLDLVAQYLATLKTPAQKPNPEGETLFSKSGCVSCHVPSLKASDGAMIPAFTDLLLHDMGADLDDGVGEPGVSSSEWRTAPLKNRYPGIANRRYLHDGSAVSVKEAVEKHGGEAQKSREAFRKLGDADKAKLIGYVNGPE
jgi:CxxC motif-containing protein (DUF1111 family)